MQSSPVQNADVVAGEVKALRQQRAQFSGSGGLFKRMPQLDHTTPLARLRSGFNSCQRQLVCRYEVRVVLGGHGSKTNFTSVKLP